MTFKTNTLGGGLRHRTRHINYCERAILVRRGVVIECSTGYDPFRRLLLDINMNHHKTSWRTVTDILGTPQLIECPRIELIDWEGSYIGIIDLQTCIVRRNPVGGNAESLL